VSTMFITKFIDYDLEEISHEESVAFQVDMMKIFGSEHTYQYMMYYIAKSLCGNSVSDFFSLLFSLLHTAKQSWWPIGDP
jgi:hypothetical protein